MLRADIDVGLYSDPKVGKLLRLQKDAELTALTLFMYTATVLASWKADEPLGLDDGAPLWFGDLVDTARMTQDLIAAELFDASGIVPAATLDRWMAPARRRSQAASDAALARWAKSGRNADAMPVDRQTTRHPVARARRIERDPDNAVDKPRSLADIMRDAGGFAGSLPKPTEVSS